MMVERRHLHHDGPFQAAEDFEGEFRAVMPAGVFGQPLFRLPFWKRKIRTRQLIWQRS